MQEISVPVSYVVNPDDNITDDVFEHAQDMPDTVGFRHQVNGTWAALLTWPGTGCAGHHAGQHAARYDTLAPTGPRQGRMAW